MKKWLLWAIVILLVGWGYYYFFGKRTEERTFTQTAVVQTGSIRNVVKATGKIYPVQSSTLSFQKQGTVSKITKSTGDTVRANEVIVEIDPKDAYLDIESANIALSNAENNYQKLIAGATETEKIRAINTLTDSRSRLTLLEEQYKNLLVERDNAIKNAETNIRTLEEKLIIAQNELEYTEKNINTDTISNNLERDVSNAYVLLEQLYQILPENIKDIRDVILIEDKSNPRYGDLSAKDPSIKSSVESLYLRVLDSEKEFEKTLGLLRQDKTSVTSLLSGLADAKEALTDLGSLTTLVISEYRASTEWIYITDSLIGTVTDDMQSLSSTFSNRLSTVNSTIASLKWYGEDDIQALADKNTLANKQASVNDTKNSLEKAKQELVTTKQSYATKILSSKQEIESQKWTISLNIASYEDAISGTDSTELTSAKNAIRSAQINLEKARLGLKDYQIISPFDGTIRDIPWQLGDTTTSTENVSIENTGAYEIQVSLDQIDIVKIREGMIAKISLDAFADTTFSGTVSSVSATPTESSSVVSYTAKILLSGIDKPIFAQMSATVEIIIAERNDIILIPASATRSEKGKTYVQVQTWRGPSASNEQREIILGATDSGKVEVLSGLTIGERIILWTSSSSLRNWSSSTRVWSGSSIQTSRTTNRAIFGGGGGGGVPPPGM